MATSLKKVLLGVVGVVVFFPMEDHPELVEDGLDHEELVVAGLDHEELELDDGRDHEELEL